MKKYECTICGYIYDDAKESVKFEDLPDDWTCPICGAPKAVFREIKEVEEIESVENLDEEEDIRELTNTEVSYICSNLAKACEKQYLKEEQDLFNELAKHYSNKENKEGTINDIQNKIDEDIKEFEKAMSTIKDRGAKRVLTWSSKATNMMNVILKNYKEKGLDYLKDTKIWVCDICGFIYVGEVPPKVCPICKVPSFKILEVK